MTENPWRGALTPEQARQRAQAYDERFDRLARAGVKMHGEADLVTELAPQGRVLDAGCGTGRVAIRLADTGHDVVGVDVDPGMLSEAAARRPDLLWVEADLADLTPEQVGGRFSVIVAAGNVMPLLTPGREEATLTQLRALLADDGLVVAGFGLDAAHLPPQTPPDAMFAATDRYDAACRRAGLELVGRWSTWQRAPFIDDSGGYAVSVHARMGA